MSILNLRSLQYFSQLEKTLAVNHVCHSLACMVEFNYSFVMKPSILLNISRNEMRILQHSSCEKKLNVHDKIKRDSTDPMLDQRCRHDCTTQPQCRHDGLGGHLKLYSQPQCLARAGALQGLLVIIPFFRILRTPSVKENPALDPSGRLNVCSFSPRPAPGGAAATVGERSLRCALKTRINSRLDLGCGRGQGTSGEPKRAAAPLGIGPKRAVTGSAEGTAGGPITPARASGKARRGLGAPRYLVPVECRVERFERERAAIFGALILQRGCCCFG